MVNGSKVVIKSGNLLFEIGSLAEMTSSGFEIVLNDSATPQLVQILVRAITYTRMVDSDVTARTIKIGIEDAENPIVEATISVTSTAVPAPPVAPTSLSLTGASIAELSLAGTVIGTVSATDGDIDDVLRYALVDDAGGRFALDGDRLIVRDAIKLDHEQATAHAVRIRVSDKHGLFQERDFAISVTNVDPENVVGTSQNDIIKGGSGNDRIFGGGGDDKIYGGGGKDTLRGDAGKDIFVFDAWPAKPKHADKILSYVKKDDSLYFDHRAFTQLGKGSFDKPIKLKKQAFWVGEGAHDASDRMIYNSKTGDLLYDEDGIGGKAAIKVAVLKKGLNLASEIWIV
jgi:Ca2+-binding RTX toxin-like protein